MYNFDIEQFLRAFDNDETKMVDAFTKQLNETLQSRKINQEKEEKAEQNVIAAWNTYAAVYYANHKNELKGLKESDLLWADETPHTIIETLIKTATLFQGLSDAMGAKPSDNFQETMTNFFEKMGW